MDGEKIYIACMGNENIDVCVCARVYPAIMAYHLVAKCHIPLLEYEVILFCYSTNHTHMCQTWINDGKGF